MCISSLRKVCLAVACLLSSMTLFAQNLIKGTVTDAGNQPLIGAGVVVEGQPTVGAITDFDGNYTIAVPANATHLRFSFIGMEDKLVEIAGQSVINVTLTEDSNLLEGVVVTALGIKRSEKAVTYNVQKLDQKVFVTREANMVNSLSGKIAGVQINETAAGAGSETKVVMRGAKSISGNNNALYVLDGIPLPTLSTTTPGDSWGIYGGSGLSGDGMSMINSEDIADMSALVGASAAALYGYKAANGILMLTSRTGEKGLKVTFSNNTTFSNPLMLPERQSVYGSAAGSYSSWGAKLVRQPSWSIEDFFQTGYNTASSVSVSGGTEHSTTYISAGYSDARGIIPNNNYNRFNTTFRHTADFLEDRVHASVLGMYMKVKEQNMISGGLYHNPLVPVYLMSPSDNLFDYTVFERYNSARNFPTQYWGANEMSMQNPFWTINRNMFLTGKDRFLLGGSLTVDLADWISLQGRVRTDFNSAIAEQKHYASSNGLFAGDYGRYYYYDQQTQQTYADVLLNINKTFGDNLIQVNATLGASIEDYFYRGLNIGGDLLGVANRFTFSNLSTGKEFSKQTFLDQTQSVFGTLNIGFKNFLFVEATAREDWSSQMASPAGVKPFFYPSLGGSVLLTEMLGMQSDILTYAKVRASIAGVGNPIQRFIFNPTYVINSDGSVRTNTWTTGPDFQPERTLSREVGLDLRLFKSKLWLSGTYYHSSTSNQVFSPTHTTASGNSVIYINAGQVDNSGVELSAQYSQDLGDFNWTTNLIWTRNVNKVVKLLDAWDGNEHFVNTELEVGGTSGAKMWLIEGRPIGEMYVAGMMTNSDGSLYVTPSDKGGVLYKAPNDGTPSTMWYAGNVNPDWTGSWRNTFSYKGISLAFMLSMRKGGVGVSLTQAAMDAYGVSLRTLANRDEGFNYAPSEITGNARNYYSVDAKDYWETISGSDGTSALGAYYIYDMTNVRLSEVSLGWDLPLKGTGFVKGLNLSLIGRNLAILYCNAPFDPEVAANAGNYGMGFDLFLAPSTRNVGFSAKITF